MDEDERMSTKTRFENEAKGLFCVLNEQKIHVILYNDARRILQAK